MFHRRGLETFHLTVIHRSRMFVSVEGLVVNITTSNTVTLYSCRDRNPRFKDKRPNPTQRNDPTWRKDEGWDRSDPRVLPTLGVVVYRSVGTVRTKPDPGPCDCEEAWRPVWKPNEKKGKGNPRLQPTLPDQFLIYVGILIWSLVVHIKMIIHILLWLIYIITSTSRNRRSDKATKITLPRHPIPLSRTEKTWKTGPSP